MFARSRVGIRGQTVNVTSFQQTDRHNEEFSLLVENVAHGAFHNSREGVEEGRCHPGTRVMILRHLEQWATASNYEYPIKWLNGPAGTGKSAILRTMAETSLKLKLLLAAFFFYRTGSRRDTSTYFLPTISYQLSRAIPSTRSFIEQAINADPLIFSQSLEAQAQALFIQPLLKASQRGQLQPNYPRLIIVDGLDECAVPAEQQEVLHVLHYIIDQLPYPFAILIASRAEHQIRQAFEVGVFPHVLSSRLTLDGVCESDADIELFYRAKFDEIARTHPLRQYLVTFDGEAWPGDATLCILVSKASGQFAYASTVIYFIASLRHNPIHRLKIILGSEPPSDSKPFKQLDLLYRTIFSTIDPAVIAMALRVLGLILVDVDHVRMMPDHIEWFLELETGDVRRCLHDLESVLVIPSDEPIYLLHASLGDFLFDRSRSGDFYINPALAYADVCRQTLRVWCKEHAMDYAGAIRIICHSNRSRFTEYFAKAQCTQQLRDAIESYGVHHILNNLDPDMTFHNRNRATYFCGAFLHCLSFLGVAKEDGLRAKQISAYENHIISKNLPLYWSTICLTTLFLGIVLAVPLSEDAAIHPSFFSDYLCSHHDLLWDEEQDGLKLISAFTYHKEDVGYGYYLSNMPQVLKKVEDIGQLYVGAIRDLLRHGATDNRLSSSSYTYEPVVEQSDTRKAVASLLIAMLPQADTDETLFYAVQDDSIPTCYIELDNLMSAVEAYRSRCRADFWNHRAKPEPEPPQPVGVDSKKPVRNSDGSVVPDLLIFAAGIAVSFAVCLVRFWWVRNISKP